MYLYISESLHSAFGEFVHCESVQEKSPLPPTCNDGATVPTSITFPKPLFPPLSHHESPPDWVHALLLSTTVQAGARHASTRIIVPLNVIHCHNCNYRYANIPAYGDTSG